MSIFNIINIDGIIIGVVTFLTIGLFHPIVVKFEYHLGTKHWWCFLLVGVFALICSFFTSNIILSSSLGVFAFSSFWSIKEVFEQKQRAIKGWTKKNPARGNEYYTISNTVDDNNSNARNKNRG